jgi:hypothetical protein
MRLNEVLVAGVEESKDLRLLFRCKGGMFLSHLQKIAPCRRILKVR